MGRQGLQTDLWQAGPQIHRTFATSENICPHLGDSRRRRWEVGRSDWDGGTCAEKWVLSRGAAGGCLLSKLAEWGHQEVPFPIFSTAGNLGGGCDGGGKEGGAIMGARGLVFGGSEGG
jgi:hypothetical protein